MHLDSLRVEDGCRMRGEAVTRLETFVDAAFAFAVTLLVVSFDAMPNSFAELYEALRRLPAFLAGFAILAMFWSAHHRFSRRFGLEDTTVVVLSLALVAMTLFYVYPLRMLMAAGLHFATGGWAPTELTVETALENRLVWIIYGSGFALLAALIAWLNLHALRSADRLGLDAAECATARMEIVIMSMLVGCAMLSMLLTALVDEHIDWVEALPGMAYGLLGLVIPLYAARAEKNVLKLAASRYTESSAPIRSAPLETRPEDIDATADDASRS